MRQILALSGLLLIGGLDAAGQSGNPGWQAHTSYGSVVSVSGDMKLVWAATKGGVFSFEPGSGEIARYSVIDGLNSVQTRTIAADPIRAVVWIGYSSGVFDRLDPESGTVTTFRDIERATQFASRGVNRIRVRGDSLLLATDFGVVVFDPLRNEVRDSYTRLGSFSAAVQATDVLVAPGDQGANRLWVSTAEGVASAPLAGVNLQDPASWTNERQGFMTTQDDATGLAYFGGSVYIGTTTDLYERRPGPTYVRKFVSSSGVRDLRVVDDRLFGAERFNLFLVESGGQAQILNLPGFQNPRGILPVDRAELWVGDEAGGLIRAGAANPASGAVTVEQVVIPDGPAESQFSDLAVGPEGSVWAGGSTESGSGFHRLAPDGSWTAFRPGSVPALEGTGSFLRVATDGLGNGWAASEGAGAARVGPEGEVTRFTPANSSLEPAPGTIEFVITGGVAADGDDNVWFTTRASAVPLHVRTADGTWGGLGPYVGDGLTARATAFGDVFVDSFDQKWVIIRNENNFNAVRGLMVLDTGNTPADDSDDVFQFFDEPGAAGLGLPSPRVTSVVEDRDGLVWVGTDSGIAYFVNTGIVAQDATARAIWPQWVDRSRGVFVLFGLQVNDLAVDPANRLWVATSQGAWQIEQVEGGYDLVRHFSADNSPLFSDEVVSVAVDPTSGRVFFATDSGLLSWEGDAIAPSPTADDLFVYPNPAVGDQQITIEGLVESAEVRIVTPGGSTVASFRSRGGRATWDGRDREGRPVPSGVYLVVAVGDDGQGTSYGRVAVVR